MTEKEKLKELDKLMNESKRKERLKGLYSQTLKLLKLEARKFELMLELVTSIAYKEMKEGLEKTGLRLTVDNQEEMLMRYVPWKHANEEQPVKAPRLTSRGEYAYLRRKQNLNFPLLRGQIKALRQTLDKITEEP